MERTPPPPCNTTTLVSGIAAEPFSAECTPKANKGSQCRVFILVRFDILVFSFGNDVWRFPPLLKCFPHLHQVWVRIVADNLLEIRGKLRFHSAGAAEQTNEGITQYPPEFFWLLVRLSCSCPLDTACITSAIGFASLLLPPWYLMSIHLMRMPSGSRHTLRPRPYVSKCTVRRVCARCFSQPHSSIRVCG